MKTENLERNLYVDTFITERPRNGIDSPHARLLSALKLNEELAEYFRDRAQIEDMYAKSIAKLTKKNYISNKAALGTFLPLWEMLQVELSQSASLHSEYSTSIIDSIEHPLRSSIHANKDFIDIQRMDEQIQRIAREYDDLEQKIHKHKKNAKGEAKAAEYTKQQEQKLAEWRETAPAFFHKHQLVDENRWNTIKSTVELFETLQQSHANAIIEMTGNTMTAASNLQVNNEIAAFCAAHAPHVVVETRASPPLQSHNQQPQQQQQESELINLDTVVPEPSVSDMSMKQESNLHPPPPPPSHAAPSIKKEKKRFFSSLVSMRRKPKSESNHASDLSVPTEQQQNGNGGRQRSFSNAGSFVESTSLHSINTHSTTDHTSEVVKSPSSAQFNGMELASPSSPTSLNPPSLRKAPSFSGSFMNGFSSQQQQQPAPLILVDAEGFSIPPPDRTAWPLDSINNTSESLLEVDDLGSDAGSLFSNNPRIRVDIKSEATEEDASQSVVALNRVSTLLKEKNSAPTARRLRGRREMRATQLYSVIEQDQMLRKIENQQPSAPAHAPSPFANPFEISQERIVEEEQESEPFSGKNANDLPQIDVHIAETVHVLSRAGEAEQSAIWGEISLLYNGPTESAAPVCFQINQPTTSLDKMDATEYVEMLDGYDNATFRLNTHLFKADESIVCLKYQVRLTKDRLPLTVKPMWKCDLDKSRLLVKYHKHHDLPTLENVMFVTSVTGDVQNALSIPAGELVLSQKRIKWHLGQIADNEEAVIKAQFTTLEQGTPQPIAVRFEIKDHLMSDVNVEYGTDALMIWAKINHICKTVKVGKYIAEV